MSKKNRIDPITLGIIINTLASFVDEMTFAVVRTSFSPLTRDAFDFQCGICQANGEMLLHGEGSVGHSEVYPNLISNWIKAHGNSIYPNDFIVTNDPYSGASHLPDIYMWHPIFVDGKLAAWSTAGGHLSDVGGSTPGSCGCDSTEIYQEGLRIPPMKLYERGAPNDSLFEIIKTNSRTPMIVIGDIEAYWSACHIGEERFLELVKQYGLEFLNVYLNELQDYAESLVRGEIMAMPDGEYEFTDYLDDDGSDSGPVRFHVRITVAGDEITYDFTGTSQQGKGALNNSYGSSRSRVDAALREMISLDIPRSGGAFRPVNTIIPEGTIINPRHPAAQGSRGATVSRLMDVMLGAEAQIRPNKIPACVSECDHLINIGGKDKEGNYFIIVETAWGGWGGRASSDGVDYMTPPFLNGANQPCELNEELYPIIYNQYGYVPDREGAGKYRGSVAVVREYKFIGEEAILQLRTDRQHFPTYGLYGGGSGSPSESVINPDTENRHVGKITISLKGGDIYRLITSGGGGWGNPLERDVNMVLNDVRNEKVSIKRARESYGVVIDEDTMEIDMDETQKLREAIKEGRGTQT